jgi:hypothetical protein
MPLPITCLKQHSTRLNPPERAGNATEEARPDRRTWCAYCLEQQGGEQEVEAPFAQRLQGVAVLRKVTDR